MATSSALAAGEIDHKTTEGHSYVSVLRLLDPSRGCGLVELSTELLYLFFHLILYCNLYLRDGTQMDERYIPYPNSGL